MIHLYKMISMGFIFILMSPLCAHSQQSSVPTMDKAGMHRETPDDAYLANPLREPATSPAYQVRGGGFFTTQVNVNSDGENILGDAANEPSIAIDPIDPNRMVIGWRQFDNVYSNFRQAGYGYSTDGGQTWTFPGVIQPGVFRSDPVLENDVEGNFYYNSLSSDMSGFFCRVFFSSNGGAGWNSGTEAYGGDKQWMVIDKTAGAGQGNIYSYWTKEYSICFPGAFTRSINGGSSYEPCVEVPGEPLWGNMAVGPDGELYVAGAGNGEGIVVVKSTSAQNPGFTVNWNFFTQIDIDGYITGWTMINPVGLLGQANIDVDRSTGAGRGNVYVLASVMRISNGDPGDVMFAKSVDGGVNWSAPVRINDDPGTDNYQWFGTMSVAPNGRIDVIWLDTRDATGNSYYSALYYSFSEDQGETWSENEKLSESFDPHVGWPQQEKMGDYFDMESDETSAHLAWANTLNGEQDVYYARIIPSIIGQEEFDGNRGDLSFTIFPNPVRDNSLIRYKIPDDCLVSLAIYDVFGKKIQSLLEKHQAAGTYQINLFSNGIQPGFYFCKLKAGIQAKTIRFVVIK